METTKTKFWTRGKKRLLFYTLILALPVIHFIIFYIYVNFNSIIMASQEYTANKDTTGYTITFAGLDNFKKVFEKLKPQPWLFSNALMHYAISLIIATPLSLLISFYLYKKAPFAGFFKVILFIPGILSGVIFVMIFKYMVTDVWSYLFKTSGLLDSGAMTMFWTLIFYNFWHGLGGHFLLYTGGMSGINESIVESAKLDGANIFQEMIYITFPMIYPTFVTFFVIELSGLFVNQRNLYTFFREGAEDLSTLGYVLFVQTLHADVLVTDPKWMTYGELTALGLMCTAVLMPLTLGAKKLLEKIGPSVD